jgi:hypothetical protein
VLDVLADQVGVEGDRRGGSLAGGGDDLGARVGGVAGHPHAGDAGAPHRVVDHPAVLVHRAAQPGEEVGVGDEAWAHEHRRPGDDAAFGQLDALELVVSDDEPGDGALDDADATGGQQLALGRADGVGVGEHDDVGRPLPDQQGVLDGLRRTPQHPQRLVADLVAMAVRAVEQVPAPSLADAGNIRQLVAQSRGHQDPAGLQS